MSKLVLLDTNFLFGKRLDSDFVNKFKEANIDMYITQIVLDELKGQNIREIKAAYEKINNAINDSKYSELYFDINNNTCLEEVFIESDSRMEKYFGKIFENHIIPISNKKKSFDTLLERSKRKIPPFSDEKGASDKGFKDTLIWIDFLNFCKENKFDEYYLVTKDNGFSKYYSTIRQEFKEVVGNDNFILLQFSALNELTNYFLKEESSNGKDVTMILPFQEDIQTQLIEIDRETIQKAKTSVHELLSTLEYDNFNEYYVSNIELYHKITDETALNFCNLLSKKKIDLIFFDYFDISDLFDDLFVRNRGIHKVEINFVMNFIEIWELIKTKFPDYVSPFITFFVTELNNLVVDEEIISSEEVLPF